MTCIFQHSAVTELEDTHTVLVSADSMHSGYKQHMKDKMVVCFLNLHAFHRVYAIHMMLRCKVECMSHIGAIQWGSIRVGLARQHACCRLARRHTFVT